MNFLFIYDKLIKILTYLIFFIFIIFQNNSLFVNASTMNQYQEMPIIEELRLYVPAKYKKVWLRAGNEIWEDWLSKQKGYEGRQIFYNEVKEEALVLVKWQNKALWKSISMDEVNQIQEIFEENIKENLNKSNYPFKFIYEGELLNQK